MERLAELIAEHYKLVSLEEKFIRIVKAYKSFSINILYWNTYYEKFIPDSFEIEGIDNAEMIFNYYRQRGFELRLHSITLVCDKKVEKKVTFKYAY